MKYPLIGLIAIALISNALPFDVWGDYGWVSGYSENAAGDYAESLTEFTDGGLTDFSAGATADSDTASVGQDGFAYTDGGYINTEVYASDDSYNEAGAETYVDGYGSYADAYLSNSAEADVYDDATSGQYADVYVPYGYAESSTWSYGWYPYAEASTSVYDGYYVTSQAAGTGSSYAWADQYTYGEGWYINAYTEASDDPYYATAWAGTDAGAYLGYIDTYQYAEADNYPEAYAEQSMYGYGWDLYTDAWSGNYDANWEGYTDVGTYVYDGQTWVDSYAWSDASYGDSYAFQGIYMDGYDGYAWTEANSIYTTWDYAYDDAGWMGYGGQAGYMDAYQDGLFATVAIW